MRLRPRRWWTAVLVPLFSVLAGAPALGQSERTDSQSQAASQPPEMQTYRAQAEAAFRREIVLTEKGPQDRSAFGDFERPFLVAQWLCLAPSKDAQDVSDKFDKLLDDREQRRWCEKVLETPELRAVSAAAMGLAVLPEDLDFVVMLKHPGSLPLTVQARDPRTAKVCHEVTDIRTGNDQPLDLVDVRKRCLGADRIDFVVESQTGPGKREVTSGFAISYELPAQLRPARTTSGGPTAGCDNFRVRLDATGVSSIRFRNPRRPLYLDTSKDVGKCATLEFYNQIVARQFLVTFSGIDPGARWDLATVSGISVRCPGPTCSATFRVGPSASVLIKLAALYKAYVKTTNAAKEPIAPQSEVISFGVSFYDDDREPANPRGYFSLVQWRFLIERKTETNWSSAASADFGSALDLTEFDQKYAPPGRKLEEMPSATLGSNDWRAQGNVRVSLKQNLGSRASGDFEVRLKSGEFGGGDPQLTATRFKVEVFALNGIALSGGRAAIASPSESIALLEAGDGLGARWGPVQVTHLFRKQVRELTPDGLDTGAFRTDREHHTTVVQATGLPVFRGATLDLYGTIGTRSQSRYAGDSTVTPPKEPAVPPPTRTDRLYGTIGGELIAAFAPGTRWTGALYLSRARTKLAEGTMPSFTDCGRGIAFLTTYAWTNFDGPEKNSEKRGIDWTFQWRYGQGSAEKEDVDSPNRQEAYLGESASFAPDVIFLAQVASAFHGREAFRPSLGREGALTPGLGNKRYVGVVLNIPRLDGLNTLVKNWLPAESFGDFSTNVRAHSYWLRQEIDNSRYLGSEVDASLTLDVPKGVKSTFTAAVFNPGGALDGVSPDPRSRLGRPFLDRLTWALTATVNVSIP